MDTRVVLCSTPPSLRDPVLASSAIPLRPGPSPPRPLFPSHSSSPLLPAPALRRPGCVLLLVSCPYRHPDRGVDGAPTGALFSLCRACEARRPRERNAGRPVATGTPSRRSTVAIFGRGPVLPPPAVAPEPISDLPAPGRKDLAGGIPDLPRCGSRRNRETPLPAPPSGSFLENAPSERGWESL